MMERNTDLREFINLRMGGFHAACIFMGVIGKRFSDAGLKDLIIESGLLGEDSAQQVLKGKQRENATEKATTICLRFMKDAMHWSHFHRVPM